MRQRTLVVMVKEPRPGRVKSRLGRNIGRVAAAWWFRHQSASMLRRLRDRRWRLVLAVSPDREGLLSRVWPVDLDRIAQGSGDLGVRMGRLLSAFPPGPVVVIGGDIPNVTPARIAEAFQALGGSASVVGPAEDGGYWLVGVRRATRLPPTMFAGVRWSTTHALDDTLPTLPQPVVRVAKLRDVDTVDDLDYLKRRKIS